MRSVILKKFVLQKFMVGEVVHTADKGKSVLRSEAAQSDFTILSLEMDI